MSLYYVKAGVMRSFKENSFVTGLFDSIRIVMNFVPDFISNSAANRLDERRARRERRPA
jgi:hypothetical protein